MACDKNKHSLLDLQEGTIIVNQEETYGLDHDPDYSDNWKFFNSKVPSVLKDYRAKGYNIFILR